MILACLPARFRFLTVSLMDALLSRFLSLALSIVIVPSSGETWPAVSCAYFFVSKILSLAFMSRFYGFSMLRLDTRLVGFLPFVVDSFDYFLVALGFVVFAAGTNVLPSASSLRSNSCSI